MDLLCSRGKGERATRLRRGQSDAPTKLKFEKKIKLYYYITIGGLYLYVMNLLGETYYDIIYALILLDAAAVRLEDISSRKRLYIYIYMYRYVIYSYRKFYYIYLLYMLLLLLLLLLYVGLGCGRESNRLVVRRKIITYYNKIESNRTRDDCVIYRESCIHFYILRSIYDIIYTYNAFVLLAQCVYTRLTFDDDHT